MRMLVIAGLVSAEKHELTADLARYYVTQGQAVAVVDNVARLRLSPAQLPADVALHRIDGNIDVTVINALIADIVIIAAAETASPEALFAALLDVLNVLTIAMIDTRTCDCFPTVRETLEHHADLTAHYPYDLTELIGTLKQYD